MKLLILLSILCVGYAQTDGECAPLQVGSTGARFPGSSALCPGIQGEQQCCTDSYLMNTAEVRSMQAFREALSSELDNRLQEFDQITTRVDTYLRGDFVSNLAMNLPLSGTLNSTQLANLQNMIMTSLGANFDIPSSGNVPDFDIDAFLSSTVGQVSDSFSQILSNVQQSQQCIQGVINQQIDTTMRSLLMNSIDGTRKSFTSLMRIKSFIMSQRDSNTFTPIQGCIERLAQWSFCGRCTRRIPPLCQGSCNNIIRGCLSPAYEAYQQDFQRVWELSRGIISNLNNMVGELFNEERDLIPDMTNLASTISTQCSIEFPTSIPGFPDLPFTLPNIPDITFPNFPTSVPDIPGFPGGIGKRQADEASRRAAVFNELMTQLENINGFIQYNADGPDFCRPMTVERGFCLDSLRNRSADRGCNMSEICTSGCNCWDGRMMMMREDDVTDYAAVGVMNTVAMQGNNPAVDGLQEDLQTQVVELQQNSPVAGFLTSDELVSVLPEGVAVPGGAVRVVVSMVIVVLVAALSLIL